MNLLIPIVREGPFFGFSVELDAKTYALTFRWNERAELWIMNIADSEGAPVIDGLRVVSDFPILSRFGGRGTLPAGEMIFVDTQSTGLDAGFEDLGDRVQLYYITATEP